MPVYQKLLSFDGLFGELRESPIILNDIPYNTSEEKEAVKELTTTRYSNDVVSLLPSCRKGCTKGEFSKGHTCPVCKTIVRPSVDDDVNPTVWLRRPNGVDKLISPICYILLKNRFTASSFNIIQWLMDTRYVSQNKPPAVLAKIQAAGIKQGYNNFVKNFGPIMNFLFDLKEFKIKKGTVDYLRMLIEQNIHCVFSEHIPLPSRAMLIIERTNVGTYVDKAVEDAVDIIETLVSIDKDFYDQRSKTKENRTAKAIAKLGSFYEKYYSENFSQKEGQFRRHWYGARTVFSGRGVIISITVPHRYDEIEVPWGMGLTMFRPHVITKLMRRGRSLNSAIGHILNHVGKFTEDLNEILCELVDETPDKGIYSIIQRNPSLMQGSAQRVKIGRFKTNPKDQCIGMSILIVKAKLNSEVLVTFYILTLL